MVIALGVSCIAVADSAFVFLTSTGNYQTGGLVDLGWMAGFAVLAVAPHRQRAHVRTEATRSAPRPAHRAAQVPVLLAAITVLVEVVSGRRFDTTSQALGAVVVLPVLARQSSLLRESGLLMATLLDREERLRH